MLLECINTLEKIVAGEPMLLNNSINPRITVGAVAKKAIKKDGIIKLGAGGFDVRGKAIKIEENKDKVPICLLRHTRLKRDIEPGHILTFDYIGLISAIVTIIARLVYIYNQYKSDNRHNKK
jgi:predicted homoserine dehydrogenase-like protein